MGLKGVDINLYEILYGRETLGGQGKYLDEIKSKEYFAKNTGDGSDTNVPQANTGSDTNVAQTNTASDTNVAEANTASDTNVPQANNASEANVGQESSSNKRGRSRSLSNSSFNSSTSLQELLITLDAINGQLAGKADVNPVVLTFVRVEYSSFFDMPKAD